MTKNFSLLDIAVLLFRRKKFFLLHFIVTSLLSVGLSLILTKYYKSTVVFMPPGQSSSGILSMLGSNFSGDLLADSKLSKRQYVAILNSRELRENLIEKFNLIDVYKLRKLPNSLDYALKVLGKKIQIKENEEGGLGITDIISVEMTVVDKNPKRASDMANYLFDLLQNKVLYLHKEIYMLQTAFISQQISANDSILSQARSTLKDFQIKNQAYDVSSQVKLSIRSLAQLESDKMALEMQKAYLQKSFTADYSEINEINQRIAISNQKIIELEKQSKTGLIPGLQNSLTISDEYIDRLKEVETYIQLNYVLRQQLEFAKLKQQKGFTEISIVDRARPAQYKFKPKRAIIVVVIVSLYMTMLLLFILLQDYYSYLRKNHPEKIDQIMRSLREN